MHQDVRGRGADRGAGCRGAQARDTLSLGMVLEPPHLDPTAGAAAAIREVTYANIYEGLVRIDAEGAVRPALAAELDDVARRADLHVQAADRRDASTTARRSIARSVAFSYGRALAPDFGERAEGPVRADRRTECPDPATAVVTLKRPDREFPVRHGLGRRGDAVAEFGRHGNKTNPVGTGPFRFLRWVRGDRVELARNPDYWGAAPKLAAVTFRFIADPAAAAAAMLAGDLDAFPNFPAPETLDRLQSRPALFRGGRHHRGQDDPGAERGAQAVRRCAGAPGAGLRDRPAGADRRRRCRASARRSARTTCRPTPAMWT